MRSRLALAAVLSLSIGIAVPAQGPGPRPGQMPVPGVPGQRTPPRAPGVPGAQEEAPTGTAVLRGFVVALDSGAPVRRAQVRAFASEARTTRMTTTDGDGRFELRELPAGRYRVSVTKSGFVSLQYGQRRPSQAGTPIEIRDKQVIDKVTIGLPRGSVIAGRILDDFGDPVAGANVSALQSRFVGGTRRWLPNGPGDRTDDLGQFRLYGLAPGEYMVSATYQMMGMDADQSPDVTGFAPTYFPGVPGLGDAQRITVAVGEENSNASFALIASRLVSIEGTVTSAEGTPVTQGFVTLMPADPSGMGPMMFMGGMGGRIENSGKFKITNVAPGRYVAQARVGGGGFGPEGPTEIGRTAVAVGDEKVENVVIAMTTGGRINGRVITDTGVPLPAGSGAGPMGIQVMARPAAGPDFGMGGGGFARVNADGTFELRGLVDPRVIRVMGPSGWIVKAVLAGGRDYVDQPIDVQPGKTVTGMEIVLTNRVGTVTGVVTDDRGQPVLDTTVLIFPDDRTQWVFDSRYVKTARPDQEGRYRIDGLPPADAYLVIAVQDLEDGRAGDPAYLATVRDVATSFGLHEGEARAIDLKLRP